MPPVIQTDSKSLSNDGRLVQQIERLQLLSDEGRNAYLGENWISDVKQLYNLEETKQVGPSFRPRVVIPQLQVLALNEVTDLTDADPKIYIVKRDGTRARPHEDSLMSQWRQGFFNNRILMAELWAQLAGIGYIQVGYDPFANCGRGEVWIADRDPSTVHIDPAARSEENWSYIIMEDRLYLEEVRKRWPEQGWRVRAKAGLHSQSKEDFGYGFSMPDGPMSVVGGLPAEKGPGDGRVKVRWLYCKDPAVGEVKIDAAVRKELEKAQQLVRPEYRPLYPNHRMVVECEGVILADGPNPFPRQLFPLIPFRGLPALTGFYCPPPARFSKGLQELAGRMYTQLFESAVRVNNAQVFIPENTGIDPNSYGGLPGEVQVINSNSQPPIITWGQPLPQHYLQLPELLLAKQKELQGFTAARMGEPSQGNVSQELYQGSIWQSKTLTRLRGRLMTESIQKLAELVFCTMAKFYVNNPQFPQFPVERQPGDAVQSDGEDFTLTQWPDISGEGDNAYNVYLDPGSIRPLSAAAQRMMVPMLKQLGMVDNETALEMLDIPGGKEIAAKARAEQSLAALNAISNPPPRGR